MIQRPHEHFRKPGTSRSLGRLGSCAGGPCWWPEPAVACGPGFAPRRGSRLGVVASSYARKALLAGSQNPTGLQPRPPGEAATLAAVAAAAALPLGGPFRGRADSVAAAGETTHVAAPLRRARRQAQCGGPASSNWITFPTGSTPSQRRNPPNTQSVSGGSTSPPRAPARARTSSMLPTGNASLIGTSVRRRAGTETSMVAASCAPTGTSDNVHTSIRAPDSRLLDRPSAAQRHRS